MNSINLTTKLGALTLKNPVVTASGTFGFGLEYAQLFDIGMLGGVVVKGLTLNPRPGNPPPRIVETPAGLLNAIGLENPGLESFLRDTLPCLKEYNVPVIVNISGNTIDEYAAMAAGLNESGVQAVEVNISCPNVKQGGMVFGTSPEQAAQVTAAVRANTALPLIVKLSPNVTDIVTIAQGVAAAGADAISLINTLLGMAIDVQRKRPALGNVFGGLSGPAVKPVALRMVWQVSQAVELPIIGMGGIASSQDALEFILAGASAVSVGTGNFINPKLTVEIIEGLAEYCREEGINDISDLIGAAWRRQ
ncbi:dihydroorotate dehydrogenase [Metallumcola ferriviriculae]|uniref:Dihydroorotate dehydrogenase n=1 Tax=Metallumcola ferriviriculae TaxID=3039180 RepID=A0AAU0UNX8_9FIRM|nr:dihydroorotate dehydrogenase [Desulfitibacteraceae bacterium MK1]